MPPIIGRRRRRRLPGRRRRRTLAQPHARVGRRRAAHDERLHRPPLRFPRPRGGVPGALRWLVAAGLLGLAGLLLVAGDPPAVAAPTAAVVVAARDLTAGVALARADVAIAQLPQGLLPRGVLRTPSGAVGRAPAGPVRRGEPLTDVRLLGPALLREAGAAGVVAAPVRVADPGVAALLRPGDRVDVVAGTQVVAGNVPVIGVPAGATDGAAEGALVILAAAPAQAARLVGTAATARLSLTVRSR